ncbi:MAG: Smr/MutS family protein [Elusimicrobiales bacterium]|nr:Smr/MutS family protein [Elusimicrobiales bacterium]
MSDDDPDKALFAEAMRKVRRAAGTNRVMVARARARPASVLPARRVEAEAGPAPIGLLPQPTDQPGVLRADGVSGERLKRLAAGRPAVQQTFDLHGITRHEALELLEAGFRQAIDSRMRALCIIHGRGLHSQGRPVLKDAVYHWLREGPFAGVVLAVIPQPGSGGGACLVLLRRK